MLYITWELDFRNHFVKIAKNFYKIYKKCKIQIISTQEIILIKYKFYLSRTKEKNFI